MELEVSLRQWNRPPEQLEESRRLLVRQAEELADISNRLSREFCGSEWTAVRRKLQKDEETLQNQISHLWNMKIALEKIRRLYEACEEEIIEAGEEKPSYSPETLAVQNLEPWNLVSFQLQAGEE